MQTFKNTFRLHFKKKFKKIKKKGNAHNKLTHLLVPRPSFRLKPSFLPLLYCKLSTRTPSSFRCISASALLRLFFKQSFPYIRIREINRWFREDRACCTGSQGVCRTRSWSDKVLCFTIYGRVSRSAFFGAYQRSFFWIARVLKGFC